MFSTCDDLGFVSIISFFNVFSLFRFSRKRCGSDARCGCHFFRKNVVEHETHCHQRRERRPHTDLDRPPSPERVSWSIRGPRSKPACRSGQDRSGQVHCEPLEGWYSAWVLVSECFLPCVVALVPRSSSYVCICENCTFIFFCIFSKTN